jgi:hypothetical protein
VKQAEAALKVYLKVRHAQPEYDEVFIARNGTSRHWFRVISDPHERFCWTTRLCSVMLLRRGISVSLGGEYDIDPHAMSLL